MIQRQLIESLRAKAARCSELAETASDLEVARALRQMAKEMESAIVALQGSGSASAANTETEDTHASTS